MIDANEVHTRFVKSGEEWADKEAAANLLEETKRTVRAQIMSGFENTSVNKAEMLAESDQRYVEHIKKMVEARKEANKAKVNYDAIRAWVDLVRSQEASRRAEMNLR